MSLLNFKYNNCLKSKNKKKYEQLVRKINQDSNHIKTIKKLPFINEIYNIKEINKIKKLSLEFRSKFDHFCIFGTGGSSLVSQALIGLIPKNKLKKFNFFYDIDPIFFEHSLEKINLFNTGFIIISKSGTTPETMGQLGSLLKKFEDLNLLSLVPKNFVIITENKKSPLNFIAKEFQIPTLIHHKEIGGRFSIFSNVALFPAAIVGIDIDGFIKGGKMFLEDRINNKNTEPINGSVIYFLMNQLYNLNINIIFTYSDALKYFGLWYRQLWSESLGKKGFGITPVQAIGTVDQHSQLQLYLDGPKDKIFTFIKTKHLNKGLIMHSKFLKKSGLKYIAGKKIGDLMEAEQNATLETLIKNKLPVREIYIKDINPESLGSLMMHCILEIIYIGKMLDVNILNQPAVEQAKILTKKYLS